MLGSIYWRILELALADTSFDKKQCLIKKVKIRNYTRFFDPFSFGNISITKNVRQNIAGLLPLTSLTHIWHH